jgi:hypothetical protein
MTLKEKFHHYLYYYKWHLFFVIFFTFIAVNLVNGFIINKQRYITVVVSGAFFSTGDMQTMLDKIIPEDVRRRDVDYFNLWADPHNVQHWMDLRNKYQAMLLARELDIGIFTEDDFVQFYDGNSLLPINTDVITGFPEGIAFYDETGVLYGIRLPQSVAVRDDMIVGIFRGTRNMGNALTVIGNIVLAWE